MPPNHLILCRPLLPLPSIFPSIKVFSSVLALCIRWPNYSRWDFPGSRVDEWVFKLRPGHFRYYVVSVWVLRRSFVIKGLPDASLGYDSSLPGGWGSPGTLRGPLWYALFHSWGLTTLCLSAAFSPVFRVQADPRDVVGSLGDHSNKADITAEWVTETLLCSQCLSKLCSHYTVVCRSVGALFLIQQSRHFN